MLRLEVAKSKQDEIKALTTLSANNSPVAFNVDCFFRLYSDIQQNVQYTWIWSQNNATIRCRKGMTANKNVGPSHVPQETATNCGGVGLQANVSTDGLFVSKYCTSRW